MSFKVFNGVLCPLIHGLLSKLEWFYSLSSPCIYSERLSSAWSMNWPLDGSCRFLSLLWSGSLPLQYGNVVPTYSWYVKFWNHKRRCNKDNRKWQRVKFNYDSKNNSKEKYLTISFTVNIEKWIPWILYIKILLKFGRIPFLRRTCRLWSFNCRSWRKNAKGFG